MSLFPSFARSLLRSYAKRHVSTDHGYAEAPKWRCPSPRRGLFAMSPFLTSTCTRWTRPTRRGCPPRRCRRCLRRLFSPLSFFPLFGPSFILLDSSSSSGFLVSSGSSSKQPGCGSTHARRPNEERPQQALSSERVLLLLFYFSQMQSHEEAVHCQIRNSPNESTLIASH